MHSTITSSGVSAYLVVNDASAAVDFYTQVFGAQELFRLTNPSDGKIGHAELKFGATKVMIADEFPDYGIRGPSEDSNTAISLHLNLHNVDTVFAEAIAKGASELRPIKDEFHGNRGGVIIDPFGHTWHLQTEIESLSAEEIQRRWARVVKD